MNSLRKDLHQANRLSWNAATEVHNRHKLDQAGFLRRGGTTLFPEELELLGDLSGKRLLHLLCNSGQDTLSLAQHGARVTGVDISDEAIDFAKGLSRDSGIEGQFVRSDVYEWLADSGESFDLAFSSYGALCWLSDLGLFFRGVFDRLVPGGRYVSLEFHPLLNCYDEGWKLRWDYFGAEPMFWDEGIGDYVGAAEGGLSPSGHDPGEDGSYVNPHPAYEFQWSVGEIVSALLEAGFQIEGLREWPYANGCKLLTDMRELPGRRMVPPEGIPQLPLMLGVVAHKP